MTLPPTRFLEEEFVPYGRQPASEFLVVKTSREGLMRFVADEVSNLVGMTDNEIAYVLGMTPRNLHRCTGGRHPVGDRTFLFQYHSSSRPSIVCRY